MSLPTSSELDPLLTRQDHRQLSCCCKLSYKPRKFSSKGAVLVLVWQFLVFCSVCTAYNPPHLKQSNNSSLLGVGLVLLVLVAIISGWLADTKVGRSKVVQTGLFITWLGVVLMTISTILTMTLSVQTTSSAVNGILAAVQYMALCTVYGGAALFFTNIVQFGLEQLPDASSDAMTAFITWLALVTVLREGSQKLTGTLLEHYAKDNISALRSIIACVLLSVAMCSKFLFSHWLIDHRQNHHPLKTVYRVLKFAKQHKYPVNRSAFTYCEDEIPSRIDLGKSKYGGPFTTEEVEDVKTFFRIIAVLSVIFIFIILVLPLLVAVPVFSGKQNFLTRLVYSMNGFFTAIVFLAYEYLVYPCIKICYRLSMLKRIGLCMFYGVFLAMVLFVYSLLTEVVSVDLNIIIIKAHHSIEILSYWFANNVLFVFFSSVMQFIYSQAPEHMKGIFLFWTTFTVVLIAALLDATVYNCYQYRYCGVYLTSVAVAFSLLVFAVYCCVARWYKRRERDEPCNERAIIEEIYGRHVEHNSIEEQDSD